MDKEKFVRDRGLPQVKCPHHWLIEPPQGPTSMGVCKLCGATKEFDNQFSRPLEVAKRSGQEQKEGELVNARRRH